jgi:acetyl-CoA carboxylase carboxyl transferase subunit beta
MDDIEKRFHHLGERLTYIRDICAGRHADVVDLLDARLKTFTRRVTGGQAADPAAELATLEELFVFMERKLETGLTPMDRVRIVRHPQRICLRDILENVYDNFTELGGMNENSIDPCMLIARAYVTRTRGKKTYNQFVMVIGHEKGHGEEFRNGGSAKPWGNAKALHYMKVAEIEGIPVHTYVFTPGSYPIEDAPGAAQQIARNLYEMAGLSVPMVTVISEGGSGGAEAIALSDKRLMLSHGYYSVISPEGAAAIEGRGHAGARASRELIEFCATHQRITAADNQCMGYVDLVIQEPNLGARPFHYDFFRILRQEVLRATDEAVLSVRGLGLFRPMTLRRLGRSGLNLDELYVRWDLSPGARMNLVRNRQKKFLRLARNAYVDRRTPFDRMRKSAMEAFRNASGLLKYALVTRHVRKLDYVAEVLGSELHLLKMRIFSPVRRMLRQMFPARSLDAAVQELTQLSEWDGRDNRKGAWAYVSERAGEDRAVTCPNAAIHGCLDLWAPDLFGEFAGVCTNCGHHFPMEYQWFIKNVFDREAVIEFNGEVEAADPLNFPKFGAKIREAQAGTGLKSGCLTFETQLDGIKLIVAVLVGAFRGGSVGAAEGAKFVEAAERAMKKHYPFLAYVHGTAGIRIQEGTNGLIQMPRCTVAVRRYIEAGGLYIVVYDTNSFAGPVASFLGCSPYQFAIRSSNLGFAGPGVITETTGMEVPPHYHGAYRALARGHIQGVWDRRETRGNLKQALLTMGGSNLYYR